jgi:L-ascorbate metabolism protein UlaG (beta-lactamase superfamily)
MQFTYYGHSCFAIEAGGKKLLFDPFISGNPLAKDVDINAIQADYILLSHGHGDHVADVAQIAKNTGAEVIAMIEVANWAKAQGCEKVHGMNMGPFQTEFGEVRMVPAAHSSSLPDGSYGGDPAGFVIKTKDGNFYYTGDTCLIMDMMLIPRYGQMDFAIMPVGGYFTMNAEDALIAADFCKVRKVVGVHFDSFPPIKIDHEKAAQAFKDAGKELILPEIGETISL